MVTAHLGKGRAILVGAMTGIVSVLLATIISAAPAHAASTIQLDWVDSLTVRFSGSAIQTPVNVQGMLVSSAFGAPPGSQAFMAISNGAIQTTFGCSVSMTLDIYPDSTGKLDYSKGEFIFSTSAPSTCTQDQLKANINGLVRSPNDGLSDLSLVGISIGSLNNRNPTTGVDTPADQIVNVTVGMGPASNYTNIPQTDVILLCEAAGNYANNVDALNNDCLARKAGTLSATPLTSSNLQTIQDGKGPNGGDEKGWTGQFKNVKAANYVACSTNFKACQLFTKNPGQIADVYVSFGLTPGSVVPGTPPGGQGADQKVCTTGPGLSGALAWILCPAVQLIASATNFFENNIIVPFLTVSPLTTNADNPIYILWQDIRNVANVGFILFFFVVIFSQATSIGISNYGIKRILPRMGLVVVGVNLSYFIVAFVIDAFNIFGAGISQLVMAALQQAGTQQLNSGTSAGTVQSIFVLGGAALLTVVVSAGAAVGWFFSFLGLALLVVVVVVIVLVVRQMAIITLVIVAPIAILASMLPNTENYYTKWRKTLTQLLMMYPMIVLLFAAGKIFGVILQQPDFKIAGDGVSNDVAQAVRVFLQFIIYVVPLVFLPATFAASGALMGRAYGLLHNSRTKGFAQKGGQSFNEGVVKPRRQELQMRAARRGGAIGWAAGYGYRRDNRRKTREQELERARGEYVANSLINSPRERNRAAGVGGEQGAGRAGLAAQNVIATLEAQGLQASIADLRRVIMAEGGANINGTWENNTDKALMAIAQGGTVTSRDGRVFDGSSQVYREGAMNVLAGDGRAQQIRELDRGFEAAGDDQNRALVTRAINNNFNSLLGKAPDLVKGKDAAFTDTTGEMLAGYHPSTTRAQIEYIQDQYTKGVAGDADAMKNYDKSVAAFNAAVESIRTTPALAAKFSGAAGKSLLYSIDMAGTLIAPDPDNPPVVTDAAVQAALTGTVNINSTTGKIA